MTASGTAKRPAEDLAGNSQTLSHPEIAHHVLQSLVEGCQVVAEDFTYVYLNEAAVSHARQPRSTLIGRTMMECFPGIEKTEMFSRLKRCMTERSHDRMETEFTFPDGGSGHFALRFVPVLSGVCVLSMDLTERNATQARLQRSEEQLRHAQKMEAVGQLAGGLAHDLNNILTVVLSYTELMLEELPEEHPLRRDIVEVSRAGKRGGELTKQLLSFSRHRMEQPGLLDLNQCITDVESMLRRLLGAQLDFSVHLTEPLWSIRADPGHIEQVLANVVVNARDAMPTGGMLTVETMNTTMDEDAAAAHLQMTPGQYVTLTVSDTGVGMDKQTAARVFEPFFTTKGGRGTGLGLSTVFGIVQQNGGNIWVYSEPGAGTTFRIYFPRAFPSAETRASTRPRPPSVPQLRQGNETVLLVEDDPQVRVVGENILRRYGYTVLAAATGAEALLASERHAGRIDMLLTDLILPKMSGAQLAERLVADFPHLRVLFMSGYTDRAVVYHNILAAGAPYIQKPLTPAALARRVREVLDAE